MVIIISTILLRYSPKKLVKLPISYVRAQTAAFNDIPNSSDTQYYQNYIRMRASSVAHYIDCVPNEAHYIDCVPRVAQGKS